MTAPREVAAIAQANQARQHCICLEEDGSSACECPVPITREQIGRLHAFLALHPERAVIYSESANQWLAALTAFLPESEDPLRSWLEEPLTLPPAADLHHSSDLGELLDELGAPSVAIMS